MSPNLLIPAGELSAGPDAGFAAQCSALLSQQKLVWELLRTNYTALEQVQTRTLQIEGSTYRLQFNPHRIISSAAKVDAKSISERKCFLCPANLPPVQRALPFEGGWLVLCNPFPIFPEHFTIPNQEHRPQRIGPTFQTFLALAGAMGPRHTVFYNGPKCGASAPDHVHFQAGSSGLMPIEGDFERFSRDGRALLSTATLRAFAYDDGVRPFIAMESSSATALREASERLMAAFAQIATGSEEPMLNILCMGRPDGWRVVIFPRAAHRPSCFYAEGEEKMVLSPASVDLGGLCICPQEKDFHRLDENRLRTALREVCLRGLRFEQLAQAVGGVR